MLTDNQIVSRNIVQQPQTKGKRDSTYDATVGKIISEGTELAGPTHMLRPRGVVWVVSTEDFHLDNETTAVAALRTTWAHKGIFALNVGVIDPGWKGPLSTALVNFSTEEFKVSLGDPFMRLMFFTHAATNPSAPPAVRDEYIKQVKKNSRNFSQSFLNMNSLVDDVSRQIFSLPKLGVRAAWAGFILAVLAIFVPIAWSLFTGVYDDKISIGKLQQRVEQLEKERQETIQRAMPVEDTSKSRATLPQDQGHDRSAVPAPKPAQSASDKPKN